MKFHLHEKSVADIAESCMDPQQDLPFYEMEDITPGVYPIPYSDFKFCQIRNRNDDTPLGYRISYHGELLIAKIKEGRPGYSRLISVYKEEAVYGKNAEPA